MNETQVAALSTVDFAKTLIIKTVKDEEKASNFLLKLKKIEKEIDELDRPSKEARQTALAFWKPARDSIKNASDIVTKMLLAHQRAERAKAAAQLEAERPKSNEDGVKRMDTTPPVSAVERVSTDNGSVGYTFRKVPVIDDLTQVPWQYLNVSPRLAEIKADILKGVIIPGCHLEDEMGLNRRTA